MMQRTCNSHDCSIYAFAAAGTLSLRTSDNYSNETFLKLIKGFWLEGDAVQPLPPDGVAAHALYPEFQFTTVEGYFTKLAAKGSL